jgi:ubiquinone/menaquinone biosynthesis C-methylase UbiE
VSGASDGVRSAYGAAASACAGGPAAAYEAMADVLVSVASTALADARVLDLGAGTGTAARAARRAGAVSIVGADVALEMLQAGSGWDAVVVCDAAALPFADDSFDLVVAAFCLGHLPAPDRALLQARRVAPALVASAFLNGWTHPAKSVVDAVATSYGYEVPQWYQWLKSEGETEVDDPERLRELALAAGYDSADVDIHDVDVDVRTPSQLTAWRLGMAHLAPFVAALDPMQRENLVRDCEHELAGAAPLIVPMMALVASRG